MISSIIYCSTCATKVYWVTRNPLTHSDVSYGGVLVLWFWSDDVPLAYTWALIFACTCRSRGDLGGCSLQSPQEVEVLMGPLGQAGGAKSPREDLHQVHTKKLGWCSAQVFSRPPAVMSLVLLTLKIDYFLYTVLWPAPPPPCTLTPRC